MATTKVWAVNDNLKRVLNYVENKDKTELKIDDLAQVIEYASNANKTENMSYVSGINCDPKNCYQQMQEVKRKFNKEDGVLAFHGYHSFSPGEVDAVTAHNMTRALMKRWLGDDFQILLCTHLDHDHLHTHFVINSVSWTTGKRFLNKHKDYRKLRELSDELSKEYGLSIIENPSNGKHYAEIESEKKYKTSYRMYIREDVDYAISQSLTWKQFLRNMEQMGYKIRMRKHISICPPGSSKYYYRLRSLSKTEDYSEAGVKEKILSKTSIAKEVASEPKKYYYHGNIKKQKKFTGFRAIYYYYCYRLGVYNSHRKYPIKVHSSLKEDIVKIDKMNEEVTILGKKKISTIEELNVHEAIAQQKVDELSKRNRSLCNKIKRTEDIELLDDLNNQHILLLKQIKELRKELEIYGRVRIRSQSMKEKLQEVKEKEEFEQIHSKKKYILH